MLNNIANLSKVRELLYTTPLYYRLLKVLGMYAC